MAQQPKKKNKHKTAAETETRQMRQTKKIGRYKKSSDGTDRNARARFSFLH